jgi:hypothetical protein
MPLALKKENRLERIICLYVGEMFPQEKEEKKKVV